MSSLRRLSVVSNEAKASVARDCLVTLFEALVQAVTYGIPLTQRLRDLVKDHSNLSFYPWGMFYSGKVRRETWYSLVGKLIESLDNGESLGNALETHFGDLLPCHVVPAILAGERNNRLADVLPVVADSLRDQSIVRNAWRSALVYPIVQFVVLYTILSGLLVFIVPKFAKMFDEMLPGEPLPSLTALVIRAGNQMQTTFGIILLLVGCFASLFLLAFIADRILRWAPWSERVLWILLASIALVVLCVGGDAGSLWAALVNIVSFLIVARVLRFIRKPSRSHWRLFWRRQVAPIKSCIPIVSGIEQRRATLDLCHAMGALVASGLDIPAAANIARADCATPRSCRELGEFLRQLEQGRFWPDAWEETVPSTPLYTWVLRNAAARQDPADGFASVAFLLSQRTERMTRRIPLWVETGGIVINAAILGMVVVGLFLPLIKLTSMLSG